MNIAGYGIRFESSDFDLVPERRFGRFVTHLAPPEEKRPLLPLPVPRTPPTPPEGGVIVEGTRTPPAPPEGGVRVDGTRALGISTNIPPSGGTRGVVGELLNIRVFRGECYLPSEAKRVFHAPYVEEINGIRYNRNPEFWSVWKYRDDLFIKATFPEAADEKSAILKFSLHSKIWELFIQDKERSIDPFRYPLDGLILYYLTVINRDIMIHASGINHRGKGYIFSGVSGKGKSTLAKLWENAGAKVIHDDRLILRNISGSYHLFNTPVYDDDEPRESPLDCIYIIGHGNENRIKKVNGAAAVSLVMSNCIQHNWSAEMIQNLLGSVSQLCSRVPVYRLEFVPDQTVIESILKNE